MSGQRPQSIELAERSGAVARNPGRYQDADSIPRADGLQPVMPDYLDQHGVEKWVELVDDFKALGVLSSDCRELFISYCVAYSQWRRCLDLVRQIGPAIIDRDRNGNIAIRKNHLSVELHKYRQAMDRCLVELGLTPSARQRLRSVGNVKQVDPYAELIGRVS